MKSNIFILTLVVCTLSACDKVDDPFPKNQGTTITLDGDTKFFSDEDLNINDTNDLKNLFSAHNWDTIKAPDNSATRFIVIEEFTGHTCLNCPRGSWEVVRLDSIYKEQLIPVSIHAGSFAETFPPSHGKYTTDHRVKGGHGEKYLNTFGVSGYPSAMVSRTNQGEVLTDAQWEARINTIKNDIPKASIELKNYVVKDSSSSAANILRIQIDIKWLENLSKNHQLQVYLTEDHIIDWQDSAGIAIENYDHRHMLRKVVNGTFGLQLEKAKIGETASYQYITAIDDSWKAKNMEAIVFIFEESPSYEVIQANAAHLR